MSRQTEFSVAQWLQVEAVFNEFLQLEESELFRDSEAADMGDNLDWALDTGTLCGLHFCRQRAQCMCTGASVYVVPHRSRL